MVQCSYPRDTRDRTYRQRNVSSRPSMEASREQVAQPCCRRDASRCRGLDLCLGGASRLRCRPEPTIHADSERSLLSESQSNVRGLDPGVPWLRIRDAKRVVGRISSGRGWCHPPGDPPGRAQVGTGIRERICRVPKPRSAIPLAAGGDTNGPEGPGVGDSGFEPLTSSASRKRSPPELIAPGNRGPCPTLREAAPGIEPGYRVLQTLA